MEELGHDPLVEISNEKQTFHLLKVLGVGSFSAAIHAKVKVAGNISENPDQTQEDVVIKRLKR